MFINFRLFTNHMKNKPIKVKNLFSFGKNSTTNQVFFALRIKEARRLNLKPKDIEDMLLIKKHKKKK